MKKEVKNKFWLVEFPIQQYKEDVVALAYENRLEIVDARFKDGIYEGLVISPTNAPVLTKIKK